jgi:hypothetical protein
VAAFIGCAVFVTPFSMRCAQHYGGGLCLQSGNTFDSVRHAQVGLRGARVLWEQPPPQGDVLSVLDDAFMTSHFYDQCRLTSITGTSDASLTGCLLTRPLTAPVYVVKKWIGLFDHFRFTPYLEKKTPPWLRWLSRGYDALFWLGFAFSAIWLGALVFGKRAAAMREVLFRNAPLVSLLVFSLVMLAEHTVLHIEDRFSLPLLPLCALSLVAYVERLAARVPSHGWRATAWPALYVLATSALFASQIVAWDKQAATNQRNQPVLATPSGVSSSPRTAAPLMHR